MVGSDEGRVYLAAMRAERHYRRPSGAVFLAQGWGDDSRYLPMLGDNQPEPLIEAAARVHLARTQKLVFDFDRFEKSPEQCHHMGGETIVAWAEGIQDP